MSFHSDQYAGEGYLIAAEPEPRTDGPTAQLPPDCSAE